MKVYPRGSLPAPGVPLHVHLHSVVQRAWCGFAHPPKVTRLAPIASPEAPTPLELGLPGEGGWEIAEASLEPKATDIHENTPHTQTHTQETHDRHRILKSQTHTLTNTRN